MFARTLIALLCVFPVASTLFAQQPPQVLRVFFDYDQSELSAEGRAALMELKRGSDCQFEVSGHTDSRGSNAYNQSLSRNRMEEVRFFLLENGVSEEQINSSYFGEEQPWKDGEEEESWKMNRRVDVFCTCSLGLEEKEASLGPDWMEIQAGRRADLDVPLQKFEFNPERDTTFSLAGGTEISLFANSLMLPKGENKLVRFEIREYVSLGQMVLGNLNTKKANGNLLETGGMLFIEAFSTEGNAVQVDSTVGFEVNFPSSNKKTGMGLWMGSTSKGYNLSWREGKSIHPPAPKFETMPPMPKNRGRVRLFVMRRFSPKRYEQMQKELSEILAKRKLIGERNKAIQEKYKQSLEETVGLYKLRPQGFGWINCDRYQRSRARLVAIRTNLKESSNFQATLVIPGDRSIMNSYVSRDGQVGFPNIPEGKPCELFVLKMEQKSCFLVKKSFSASSELVEVSNWVELSYEELAEQLANYGPA